MAIRVRTVKPHVHAGENDAGDATGATIPTSHAASHASGSTDPITPASIGAADTDHSADHETGGSDALAHLAASVIDSGTLDGDRLPAMSAGKAGAVPATGAPANHYLRDDGFAHPAQAEIDGLETTATPRFAGLGIGTAGASNEARLVEGARVGIVGGPALAFRDAVERLELLDGDLVVGDSLPVPGSGMSWSATDITDMTIVRVFAELDGVLFAGAGKYDGSLVAGRVLRLTDGVWSSVLSTPAWLGVLDLCAHNGALFAAMSGYNRVYRSLDGGATWDYSSPVADPITTYWDVSLLSYGGKLYCGHHGGNSDQRSIISSSADGVTWVEEFSIQPYASGDFYSLVHHAGYLYAVAVVSDAAKIYRAIPGSGNWTLVHSASGCSDWTTGWLVSFGGYLYCSLDASIIRSADAGATWTTAANVSIGGRWAVHNGQLYTSRGKTISVSSDGVSWTTSRTSSQTSVYGMLSFGGSLYAGTGDSGYVEIGADATYVPARGVKSFGDVEFFGRLEPSGNCGSLGQLLMSRGVNTPSWLPTGADKTYLAGAADGVPVYQQIPSTDIAMSATDKLLGRATAGAGAGEEIACTAAGRALLDDATAADQRTTLGLGTGDSPEFKTVKLTNLTDGYVPYHANDASGLGNTGMYWDNANSRLGIGTATPAKPLHVDAGNDYVRFDSSANTETGARGFIIINPTTYDYLNIWNYGADLMAIQSADEAGYRRLTINPNGGNVLIGTTTDTAGVRLKVVGGSIATDKGLSVGSATTDADDGSINTTKTVTTVEGGFSVKLTAGENLSRGEVVYVKIANGADGKVWKAPTSGDMPIGVVFADALANAEVVVITSGIAYVLPESGITAARGNVIFTSASAAGRVAQSATVPTTEHWRECGHFLDTGSGNGAITRALIHFN